MPLIDRILGGALRGRFQGREHIDRLVDFLFVPELAGALPYPEGEMRAEFEQLTKDEEQQEALKKTLVNLTEKLYATARGIRRKVRANIAVATARSGADSLEVANLGGKSGVRRARSNGTDGATNAANPAA
jgi:hypothetical protein